MSSLREKATINFYTWESRGRGYFLFHAPVEIEPPYAPFIRVNGSNEEYVDDGRVPTLLGRFTKLINPPEQEQNKDNEGVDILPTQVNPQPKLHCFSILFPKGTDISVSLMHEVLNLLSFSEGSFSFEVLAQNGEISIQCTSSKNDSTRLRSHLKAFFPTAIIQIKEVLDIGFDFNEPVAIADFGLDNEFMLPIAGTEALTIDPLTSIIATLGSLGENETAIFQVIFKGVTAPWSHDIQYAVSDGRGGSFFEGHPQFIVGTNEKVSNSLFAVVMRIGAQGQTEEQSRYITSELARSITTVSRSKYNRLIPLSNEGYEYDDHLRNIFYRTTNRIGFILNTKELAHFVHYPNKTVVHEKLGISGGKTKRQKDISVKGIYIGTNSHLGQEYPVYIDTESRLSHTHIIGVTGTGKSTLIANMMLADIEQNRGCALFDPHGDICDDIVKRIPEHRKDDVIIIDPSDSDFPIGFNLLEAHTEAEKIVLCSDLVSAFKRHATAWGDNMTAVLQNAVNTILESTRGGTLIELKRFLIEESFRNEYLTSVDDPSLHYYWHNEYPMVRKGIAPLLTRIDTFLRPKLVRYMLAQKKGVDVAQCIQENKIVLLKLSQGLIGEHNSYLLGSLFLAKFNQAALARQAQKKDARSPYMLYLDEFQDFITPSVERILSGARKYALGITLAHQELGQIGDSSLLNSVLSNPKIRICFRLGDTDAKRIESSFSYFEQSDLQSLGIGQAIMRVGSSQDDFNISTFPLSEAEVNAKVNRDFIVSNTRDDYAQPKEKLDELLISLLPKQTHFKKEPKEKAVTKQRQEEVIEVVESIKEVEAVKEETTNSSTISNKQKNEYLKQVDEQEQLRKHRSIQNFIRTIAHQRGYKVSIEEELPNGKRVDVGLAKDGIRIAIEVSVSNSNSYEAQNIQKCINYGYQVVYLVSESEVHLKNIKNEVAKILETKQKKRVFYIKPEELVQYLDIPIKEETKAPPKRVKGWRIDVNYHPDDAMNMPNKNIASKLKNLLKKKK
ncbi:MAG: ATP-binding protein [bacterium]|nr:ATP-binding protein [bacterium]